MDGVCGFLATVDSSEGIPTGCYAISISYAGSTVYLGHVKKNGKSRLGHFFPINPSRLLALKVASMEINLLRRDHSYTKELPFGSVVIPPEDLLSDRLLEPVKLSVQISNSQFVSSACSLSIRIQKVRKDTTFTEPSGENAVISPCLLQLCIARSEICMDEWNSQFYCRLDLPNGDCSTTITGSGQTPSWNHILYLSNPTRTKHIDCTFHLYRCGDMFDNYLGSGTFCLKLIPTSETVVEHQCDILQTKTKVATIFYSVKYISCYATCSRPSPVQTRTTPSLSVSSANARSVSSDRSRLRNSEAPFVSIRPTVTSRSSVAGKQFRFVKIQESFR